MPAEAVDAFLAGGPGDGSSLLLTELRQLGGAAGRPHPGGGALSHIEGSFVFFTVAIAPTPEMAAQGQLEADRLVESLRAWSNGRLYLNFAEQQADVTSGFEADAYARLQAVRASVDPDGVMVANHRVPATSVTLPEQR